MISPYTTFDNSSPARPQGAHRSGRRCLERAREAARCSSRRHSPRSRRWPGMVDQPLGQRTRQHQLALDDRDEAVAETVEPEFTPARPRDRVVLMGQHLDMPRLAHHRREHPAVTVLLHAPRFENRRQLSGDRQLKWDPCLGIGKTNMQISKCRLIPTGLFYSVFSSTFWPVAANLTIRYQTESGFEAASMIQEYEARIAVLERLVGKQALELEFQKGALGQGRRRRSAPMSVIGLVGVLEDAG